MSGGTHSAERMLELSGEDQQADAEMPHATLLQMIEEENTSDDGIDKLKSFLSTYLERIKETDLVRMLQGYSFFKDSRRGLCIRLHALRRALSGHFEYRVYSAWRLHVYATWHLHLHPDQWGPGNVLCRQCASESTTFQPLTCGWPFCATGETKRSPTTSSGLPSGAQSQIPHSAPRPRRQRG